MESYWKRGFVTQLLPVEIPFFAILEKIGLPLRSHCLAIGNPMATQWHPSGCKLARYTTKWIKQRGLYYLIKLLREKSSNQIVEKLTINLIIPRFVHYYLYWFKLEVVERTHSRSRSKLARRGNIRKTLMIFRGLGVMESIVQRRSSQCYHYICIN